MTEQRTVEVGSAIIVLTDTNAPFRESQTACLSQEERRAKPSFNKQSHRRWNSQKRGVKATPGSKPRTVPRSA